MFTRLARAVHFIEDAVSNTDPGCLIAPIVIGLLFFGGAIVQCNHR